ncbi:MAG: orotidine-5'-phosphate decarboxylase [Bacteroidetes bacterium]|nr:orotidine-5'-phosphate decarboxylase [Bacteroidota bacterium]
MNRQELIDQIRKKKSYLCVGLDTDFSKIPSHLQSDPDPVFAFNRGIIEATVDYCVAYKPNLAFYEALGARGWESLQKTIDYIPKTHFTIADAKRGDIGNTSTLYAKAFFESLKVDALTVAPYMGSDSVKPFLGFKDKWVILLVHTSNPGSADFQLLESRDGKRFYENVLLASQQWGTPENLMYVVGATRADKIAAIRALAPEHFFLVPGIGAQGGDLEEVSKHGLNRDIGLLVNASRSILYASSGKDFGEQAAVEAGKLQQQMERILNSR